MERGIFAAFLATGAALVVFACSSSNTSTFPGTEPPPDADPPPISSIIPDSGSDADAAPTSCTPAIPDGFAPTWNPQMTIAQNKCTADDLTSYYNACLAAAATPDTCTTFKSAHADCSACIEPTDDSGPIQWHDIPGKPRFYYTINVAGCLALEQNAFGASDCGGAYNAAVQCGRSSCESCFTIGGTFDQFSACQQAVSKEGVCKSYEDVQASTCAGISDPDASTSQCFKGTSESADVFYPRIAGIFCGPPS